MLHASGRLQGFIPQQWAHFQDRILALHTVRCTMVQHLQTERSKHKFRNADCYHARCNIQNQAIPVVQLMNFQKLSTVTF
jgi:hypothetical protein